jgi:hypothetical protein
MYIRKKATEPNPIPLKQRLLASVREVRDHTGWGPNTIYKLIKDGELKSVKAGARRSITVESLLAKVNGEAA